MKNLFFSVLSFLFLLPTSSKANTPFTIEANPSKFVDGWCPDAEFEYGGVDFWFEFCGEKAQGHASYAGQKLASLKFKDTGRGSLRATLTTRQFGLEVGLKIYIRKYDGALAYKTGWYNVLRQKWEWGKRSDW